MSECKEEGNNGNCVVVSTEFDQQLNLDLEAINNHLFKKINYQEPKQINIKNSSDIIIGNVTHFHGDVAISHSQNRSQVSKVELRNNNHCDQKFNNNSEILKEQQDQVEKLTEKRKPLLTWQKWLIFLTIVSTIAIATFIAIYFTLNVLFSNISPPNYDVDENQNFTIDGKHYIFDRRIWGGTIPKGFIPKLVHPTRFVVICHTVYDFVHDFKSCAKNMRNMQSFHINDNLPDIWYNFVVCGDGNVYVGRGWNYNNGRLNDSVQIAFTGNFVYDELNDDMIAAAQLLINYGVVKGKLSPDYVLVGHNQTTYTISPGKNIYKVIKNWSHFFNGSIVDGHLVP